MTCVTCATCGREWCNEEKGYHCLRAALAARDAELATLRARLEEFQMASGLCVPAEEDGGDPGGVEPRHVESLIRKLDKAHQAALSDVARLTRERDEARGKALDEVADALSNLPHVAGIVRALAAKGGA